MKMKKVSEEEKKDRLRPRAHYESFMLRVGTLWGFKAHRCPGKDASTQIL